MSQEQIITQQEPSAFQQKPSTFQQELSITHEHPSTHQQELSTHKHQQEPSTTHEHPSTNQQEPSTNQQEQSTNQQEQSTNQQQPSTIAANVAYYAGAAKETVGQLTGNVKLQEDGAAQKQQAQADLNAINPSTTKQESSTLQQEPSTNQQQEPSTVSANAAYYTGAAKETAGKLTGNVKLQEEGTAEKQQAQAELNTTNQQEPSTNQQQEPSTVSANAAYYTGAAKETAGKLTGNVKLQEEGTAEKQQAQAELNTTNQQEPSTNQQQEPSTVSANAAYYTGAAKETAGKLTGNVKLQEEGATQKQQAQAELSAQNTTTTNTTTEPSSTYIPPSDPSKYSGNYNSAIGSVKEIVGSAVGIESLQAKGAQQSKAGNVEVEAAKDSEYIAGAGNKITGVVKEKIGHLVGNEQLEAEGKATKLAGEHTMKVNEY
ncbi:hypothetical protein G9A89_015310 [Geosiphon pyriformis]|nr:hypothetical protein G9A89_015310 [Geosiphon pyriformis]